jgi:hypothetical protein
MAASAAAAAAAAVPLSPTKLDRQKQDRVRRLRKALCVRSEFPETKTMIDSEGHLNRDYFRVRPAVEDRRWTDDDAHALLTGLQRLGVGRFAEIQQELLPDWVKRRWRSPLSTPHSRRWAACASRSSSSPSRRCGYWAHAT